MRKYRTVDEITDDIVDMDMYSDVDFYDYYDTAYSDFYADRFMFRIKDAKTYDTIKTYSNLSEFMRSDEYTKYYNSPVVDIYYPTDYFECFYGVVWVIETETTIDVETKLAELKERDIAISFKFNDTDESPVLKMIKGTINACLASFHNTLEEELIVAEAVRACSVVRAENIYSVAEYSRLTIRDIFPAGKKWICHYLLHSAVYNGTFYSPDPSESLAISSLSDSLFIRHIVRL